MFYSYRNILKVKLEEKVLKNSGYSLRAFARDLDILPSRLSEILNGKRGVSLKKGETIAHNLNLSPMEKEKFLTSILALHSRSKREREQAEFKLLELIRDQEESYISKEKFSVISSWYHYAILELLTIDENFSSPIKIAKRLGISVLQARQALDRLLKLELIALENDQYKVKTETTFTTNDISSDALKAHHEQHLNFAIKSLYGQSTHEREVSSTTIALDSSKVSEFKILIREFRQKLAAIADNSTNKDSVYLLGTQLFRLDKEIKNV